MESEASTVAEGGLRDRPSKRLAVRAIYHPLSQLNSGGFIDLDSTIMSHRIYTCIGLLLTMNPIISDQLSCTKCRARKVKCDRVKPCQSCCLRGEPQECRFPGSETTDLQAVNQAYEIRRLRKEVDSWKQKFEALQRENALPSQRQADTERLQDRPYTTTTSSSRTMSVGGSSEHNSGRTSDLARIDDTSHIHFGAPGLLVLHHLYLTISLTSHLSNCF